MNAPATAAATTVIREPSASAATRNDIDSGHARRHFERLPRTGVIKRFMVRKVVRGTAGRHDADRRLRSTAACEQRDSADG